MLTISPNWDVSLSCSTLSTNIKQRNIVTLNTCASPIKMSKLKYENHLLVTLLESNQSITYVIIEVKGNRCSFSIDITDHKKKSFVPQFLFNFSQCLIINIRRQHSLLSDTVYSFALTFLCRHGNLWRSQQEAGTFPISQPTTFVSLQIWRCYSCVADNVCLVSLISQLNDQFLTDKKSQHPNPLYLIWVWYLKKKNWYLITITINM